MPYNRISAMGVQQGLVSDEERFNAQRADAVRRAHMAALMAQGAPGSRSSAGSFGADSGGDREAYDQLRRPRAPEIIGQGGRPYADIANFNDGQKAQMDLLKQQGANQQADSRIRAEPNNRYAAIKEQEFAAGAAGRKSMADLLEEISSPGRSVPMAGPTEDGSPLTMQTNPGGRFGSLDPLQRARVQMGMLGGGASIPNFKREDAEAELLENNLEESRYQKGVLAAERAAKKKDPTDPVAANKIRTEGGADVVANDIDESNPFFSSPGMMDTMKMLNEAVARANAPTPGIEAAKDFFSSDWLPQRPSDNRGKGPVLSLRPNEHEGDYLAESRQQVNAMVQSMLARARGEGVNPHAVLNFLKKKGLLPKGWTDAVLPRESLAK